MHRPRALAVLLPLVSFLPFSLMAQRTSSRPRPASSGATRSGDILPFKATETTLPNGLRVIVVPTGFPNIVSLQIPVQTGSRNEVEPGKSGFAHFFEHMMGRGTKTYTQARYNEIMTKAGARENAYTTDDYTNYYATFAKEDLDTILKVEADRFQHLWYTPEDFKTESRAVLGEYNKNSANPENKLYEALREHSFTTHTYRHTTMGFLKDIEDMPNQFEYSRLFFDRWYRPEHTAIIVAGDVTADEVLPIVRKYWGGWKRGSFTVNVPKEPPPKGPGYVHVPWETPTLPLVVVAFHNPAFSERSKDNPALDMVATLFFGETSELYKRLVVQEQKVDQLQVGNTSNADPELFSVQARVKDPKDAVYVRDQILRTAAEARAHEVPARRLAEAKSNARYSLLRTLDNTDAIASLLAQYVRYRRSYATLNAAYRLYDALTPADLRKTAAKYFTDAGLVVATLSRETLPNGIDTPPKLATLQVAAVDGVEDGLNAVVTLPQALVTPRPAAADIDILQQKTPLQQLNLKVLFPTGSAADPPGKEGLAALAGAMIAEAGSKAMTIDQINAAFYPVAGSFTAQVDKEMTTFTGRIHRDNWRGFTSVALPQLVDPGFRDDDFRRLKEAQLAALTQDLRANNEEELGKERLQTNIFRGTPYAHPALGTVAGITAITIDDVKQFVRDHYTRDGMMVGTNGDAPEEMLATLRAGLGRLPAAPTRTAPASRPIAATRPKGMEVEIIAKDTRATAISFGLPISVTRPDPDFAALSVARAWLGEHRASSGRLFERIRAIRGMNYGDYAYIEAFPRGMYQFFPDPNIARRAQIFEIWIRPVLPVNAHMALRTAVYELANLIDKGMTQKDFDATRNYLMKNAYVVTATQNQQLGYALDSKWYGLPEFTTYMRDRLSRLTLDDVNRALKQHLSAKNLSVVMITKDADGLKRQLVSDAFSPISYDAAKPPDVLAEDTVIGALKLGVAADRVRITPVEEVFAR